LAVKEDGNERVWNIKYLTTQVIITADVTEDKIGWKMKECHKQVVSWKLHDTRPVGKPRTGWKGVIQRDMS
jgi:hypothetical protein